MYRTLLALLCAVVISNEVIGDDPIGFNRDVRSILSDKCFLCHGPDNKKREADLRLDRRESAIEHGAIKPGLPDQSELIARIVSDDPDLRMPPDSTKLDRLTAEEVGILRSWIEQGAIYEDHWSFLPIKRFREPSNASVPSIDDWIQRGLAKRGLAQQPEADRATLIRRLTFDLIGLPPTPEEVQSFVSDRSPDAYEKLVDRLLASKHFGEKQAVDWLDISRYADSYGFQVDRERDVWRWRDWVVQVFNDNLPFDQFATWQLAGDLLPNATQDQILATTFNRLHQQESEGGSVEEEYRVEYVCDRVQTFATAFLGLTFECARCHDHKYDPITQKDYYQLFSMFHNIDEAGLYSYFTMSPPTPTLWLTDAATEERLKSLRSTVQMLESQTDSLREQRRANFENWLAEFKKLDTQTAQQKWETLQSSESRNELGRFPLDRLDGDKLANEVKADAPSILRGENKLVEGHRGNAIQFTGDDPVDLPFGNFQRHEPFTVSLWMRASNLPGSKDPRTISTESDATHDGAVRIHTDRAVIFHRSRAWTDAASRGYELLIVDGKLQWSLIHFWPGNAISIATRQAIPADTWIHVAVSYDGSSSARGLKIYVDGLETPVDIIKDQLTKEITGGGGDNIALAERFRDRGFKLGRIDDFRVFGRLLTPMEIDDLHRSDTFQTTPEDLTSTASKTEESSEDHAFREKLLDWYLSTQDEAWKEHLRALREARATYYQAGDAVTEIMAMRELPNRKQAYILERGEYDKRLDPVDAGVPAFLPPLPSGAPNNRLGLAQWLTSPDHPLMARVTVNRIWQSLFGRGLVKTTEDFGSQGSRPLYPEVLDRLADQFAHEGWDLKGLIKTIVMSHTYRQRSFADRKWMEEDPENELLARGPRFRLPAEMIRDQVLSISGLLNRQIGGPPVNPYEMSEAFKPVAPSGDNGVFRRSLYTQWRRTGPPPAMLAFDAPRRAVCTSRRERTDSPLQSLILLNGVQYVEAARVLGESLYNQHQGAIEPMIETGFMLTQSRVPDAKEIDILKRLYREQREYFESHPQDAEQLLAIGTKPRDASISAIDSAAATVLAQTLLNHDACVVKR